MYLVASLGIPATNPISMLLSVNYFLLNGKICYPLISNFIQISRPTHCFDGSFYSLEIKSGEVLNSFCEKALLKDEKLLSNRKYNLLLHTSS